MDIANRSAFNISSDEDERLFSLTSTTIVASVVSIIISVTIVGNILVILSYLRDPHLQAKVGNLFIVNLAITDFLVGSLSLTLNLSRFLKGYWQHGEVVCKLWLVIDSSVCWISMVTMALISWDRYCLVTKGLRYRSFQTKRRVGVLLVIVWTGVIAFFSLLTFSWTPISGRQNVDYTRACRMEFLFDPYWTVFINLISFAALLSIAIILNLYVFKEIRRRSCRKSTVVHISSRNIGPQSPDKIADRLPGESEDTQGEQSQHSGDIMEVKLDGNSSKITESTRYLVTIRNIGDNTSNSDIVGPNNIDVAVDDKSEKMHFARHRKSAIVLSLITGSFILFWTPYKVMTVFFPFCGPGCVPAATWELLEVLAWCNSTINPFIYAATNVHFRRNFRHFLFLDRWKSVRSRTMDS
ncbi:muscarinic acetylcholine receptor M5-like [Lytechinus pictus]|uniref:muscarinic acetylcholine receptor M5-like n=1 Tax=Lytechinus pictus TaxID=7653 RepID=UPI0030B9AD7B